MVGDLSAVQRDAEEKAAAAMERDTAHPNITFEVGAEKADAVAELLAQNKAIDVTVVNTVTQEVAAAGVLLPGTTAGSSTAREGRFQE
ncbi:hypothetical protein [Streptomyces sp. NPDC046727]|uniref:hypothetical protein n=1 Tax=Streptomyces sp. NPDC046727 TaxID=3155373 RepID=UPI0033C068DE